ncbi:MAG: hypothetical protein ABJH06_03335 [Paraglaciecola sp.]|uniref:hypothetical protein n=1 Tax=Paraglaciecola sp. TaxID=1920173 RepID=UPI003296988F
MDTRKLKEYCRAENRVCPNPPQWAKLHQLLIRSGGQKDLPLPLILGYWHESTHIEKSTCVEEQIDWAAKNNCLQVLAEYLLQLRSEHWLTKV